MLRTKFQLMHSREADLHQQSPSPSSSHNKVRELIISRHSNRHAPRNTKERKVRSKIRWFTEFCNSHYLSHFAAFFIDARAKRSVVESCIKFRPLRGLTFYKTMHIVCDKGQSAVPANHKWFAAPITEDYKLWKCTGVEWIWERGWAHASWRRQHQAHFKTR